MIINFLIIIQGNDGYLETKKRDQIKASKCEKEGIKLLYWDYRDEITDANLSQLLLVAHESLPKLKSSVHKVFKTSKKKNITEQSSIVCYSFEGKYVNRYSSLKEASTDKQVSSTSISKVLRGERNSAAGYIWKKYENMEEIPDSITVEFDKHKTNEGKTYAVVQYSLDGEILNTFTSVSEAENITGVSGRQIKENVNNRQKTAGGYVWKKKE